jgi:hypothetical protein
MDTRSAAYWRRAAALDPSLLHWETSAADLDRLDFGRSAIRDRRCSEPWPGRNPSCSAITP